MNIYRVFLLLLDG